MARYPAILTLLLALFALFTTTLAQVVAPAVPLAPEPAVPVVPAVGTTASTASSASAATTPSPSASPSSATTKPPSSASSSSATALPVVPPGVGGVIGGVPTPVATQYPTIIQVPTVVMMTGADGRVTATISQTMFTQTFASTALERWRFETPRVGSVGLGGLRG